MAQTLLIKRHPNGQFRSDAMTLKLKLVGALFGGLVLAMSAPVASAYTVTYNGTLQFDDVSGTTAPLATCTYTPPADATGGPDQAAVKAMLVNVCGADPAIVEFYKSEVGGADGANYNTAFDLTPTDPSKATITYSGPLSANCLLTLGCWLAVKDGNQDPAIYGFNLSNWDGTSTIVLAGFWPNQGAISNVSLWGQTDTLIDDDDIPEPASLALVGIALLAAGAASRRRRV